jgi:hypothetical protein
MWRKVWSAAESSIGDMRGWFALASVIAFFSREIEVAIYGILLAIYCQLVKMSKAEAFSKQA